MEFEIIGEITDIEVIAEDNRIRNLKNLNKRHGYCKRWRKLKGFAIIRAHNGRSAIAELHWYECHGKGRKGMKVKQIMKLL